jgi:hypothetical protein
MVSVVALTDPPPRLSTQTTVSTNTVTVVVMDALQGEEDAQQFIRQLCGITTGVPESDIQAIDMGQFACSRLVRVTFYDARKAARFVQMLDQDTRVSAVLDFKNGSNRSVVVPETPSVDLLIKKFSTFGEIEKIWLNQDGSYTVDFFDARAPLRIVDRLNSVTPQRV